MRLLVGSLVYLDSWEDGWQVPSRSGNLRRRSRSGSTTRRVPAAGPGAGWPSGPGVGRSRSALAMIAALWVKSGSPLVLQDRTGRQRTPSRARMRRIWLRLPWIPWAWTTSARASRVQCATASGVSGAAGRRVPSGQAAGRVLRARAMIRPQSSSLSLGGRPERGGHRGRRCRRGGTVQPPGDRDGWQPSSAVSWVTLAPAQLPVMMRAPWIQLAGVSGAGQLAQGAFLGRVGGWLGI
jgi:hypothetical protein